MTTGHISETVREGFLEEVTVKTQRRSPGKAKDQRVSIPSEGEDEHKGWEAETGELFAEEEGKEERGPCVAGVGGGAPGASGAVTWRRAGERAGQAVRL